VQDLRPHPGCRALHDVQWPQACCRQLLTGRLHRTDLENHRVKIPPRSIESSIYATTVEQNKGPWSRGYDVALTWRRSPVQIWPGPPSINNLARPDLNQRLAVRYISIQPRVAKFQRAALCAARPQPKASPSQHTPISLRIPTKIANPKCVRPGAYPQSPIYTHNGPIDILNASLRAYDPTTTKQVGPITYLIRPHRAWEFNPRSKSTANMHIMVER
jgi:hypothetical protein